MRHLHETVSKCRHGNAERENLGIDLRRAFFVNTGRPARKDDAFWLERENIPQPDVEATISEKTCTANPPRDHLGVLRTKSRMRVLEWAGGVAVFTAIMRIRFEWFGVRLLNDRSAESPCP